MGIIKYLSILVKCQFVIIHRCFPQSYYSKDKNYTESPIKKQPPNNQMVVFNLYGDVENLDIK